MRVTLEVKDFSSEACLTMDSKLQRAIIFSDDIDIKKGEMMINFRFHSKSNVWIDLIDES